MAFAFVFQSLPPIIGLIKAELHLSYAQSGLLMGLFALPGIFLTIPAGILSDRYGMKRAGVASLILMIIGTLVAASGKSFPIVGLGRAISGLGALTLTIVAAQLVTHWFIEGDLGKAMGLYNTAMPIGTIIAFNTFGIIGQRFGWRAPILLTSIISLLMLGIFLIGYREPPNRAHLAADSRGLMKGLREVGAPIWLVGISWLWFNAAGIAFLTFGPEFFSSRGYSLAAASLIASFFMWGALIVSPIIGLTIDRIFTKEFLIIAGNLIMVAIFLLTPVSGIFIITLMVMLGFAAALVPAPTFSLPADIISPNRLGLGFGIISTCLNIGIVVGPFLVGFLRDRSGSFSPGFFLMAFFSLLSAASIVAMRFRRPA